MKMLLAAIAALLVVPGVAAAQDISGPRVEARIGWETPTVSGDGDVYKIGQAVSYGAEAGYDVALSEKVALGGYVNYEASGVNLCDSGYCIGENGNLGAGARLTFGLGGRAAIYVKGGYARISMKASSGGVSDSESKSGVQGGLGFEFGVASHVYAFVEGSYADYGSLYGINLQRRHVAGGVGFRF
jgi:outer membrane immunogenic protein